MYVLSETVIIFWDVTPCSLVEAINVSEERIASIFRVQVEVKHAQSKKQAGLTFRL
jgi:hypothetical protein